MIHVRVVSPEELTTPLLDLLGPVPGVFNLTVERSVVRNPEGDAVQFDMVRGVANDVIERIRGIGIGERGSIVMEPISTSIFPSAAQSGSGRSRFEELAPVWEEVEARIRGDARFAPSWYGLMVIAGLIAAVGLVSNSQILIVGAMVVGPEYGAIVAWAFGINRRDTDLITRSAIALTAGFALVVIATILLGLVIRGGGLASHAFTLGVRPVSNLVNTPNWLSFIVAMLAGIVGVISLTEARANTLIGVFISVTTIPAAADIGVSLAFGSGQEELGWTEQLFLNVFVLGSVAAAGIPAQRAIWRRVTRSRGVPPGAVSP